MTHACSPFGGAALVRGAALLVRTGAALLGVEVVVVGAVTSSGSECALGVSDPQPVKKPIKTIGEASAMRVMRHLPPDRRASHARSCLHRRPFPAHQGGV